VHPKLRNPNQIGQTPAEQAIFERILGRGLVDLGRRFDPGNDRLFTWWAPWRNLRERNIGWRLDYVLCSEALAPRALTCQAEREFGTSDHGPVTALFDGPLVDTYMPSPEPTPTPGKAEAPRQGQLLLDLTPRRE
jgi:exodeoxyribonuclease-3